jgi:UDP-glucose 4-epimerase
MAISVCVVGGAGYIGSHMVKLLAIKGCKVTTLDNLSTGYRDAVLAGDFIQGDLSDTVFLDNFFSEHAFDAIMHFASFIQVGESLQQPEKYYQNNVVNTLNLLNSMCKHNVKRIIFSSTAATFGEPKYTPIDETHPQTPINPYGRSKLMIEQILSDYDQAYGLKSVCLRYFNAAGADPEGQLGERHDPETHLIPLVLQTASGRRQEIKVFGQDYDTPDGTCIRDYIHVCDLCDAHWLALEYLFKTSSSQSFNLGNGSGFSVKEVIDTAKLVTQKEIKAVYTSRRKGDPAVLVADSTSARTILKWNPKITNIESIVEHAWKWERFISAMPIQGS